MFTRLMVGIVAMALVGVATAHAAIIHESASIGPRQINCCGIVSIFSGDFQSLGNPQWLGSRFSIDQDVHVDAIGGIIQRDLGTFFGALVRLDSPTALPHGSPFTVDELVISIELENVPSGPNISMDYRQAVSVDLLAGHYGLIFGAGILTDSGYGGMHQGAGLDIAGQSSYFSYSNSGTFPGGPQWQQANFSSTRFVVEGTFIPPAPIPIPVPATLPLMGSGLALLGFMGWRRRRIGAASTALPAR